MARIFGAPVIEPQGKSAAKISRIVWPGSSLARTVLSIWCTVAKLSMRSISGTSSVPNSEISAMSLRKRSTIIRFSDWFSDR